MNSISISPFRFEQEREPEILKNVHPSIFQRTNESLDAERSILIKGATPKQGKMFEEKCIKKICFQGQEKSLMHELFFSEKNMKNLQNMIRLTVHKFSGFVISSQSKEELTIVMRSIYFQYSKNLVVTDIVKQKKDILKEIDRLNQIVINEVTPNIISETQQYLHYLKDISEIATPHSIGENDSVKGTKQFRDISEVFRI